MIVSNPKFGDIISRDGMIDESFALFLEEVTERLNNLNVESYLVASLPPANETTRIVFVTDETGGAVLAFNDGTNWRRTTDRAVVS